MQMGIDRSRDKMQRLQGWLHLESIGDFESEGLCTLTLAGECHDFKL